MNQSVSHDTLIAHSANDIGRAQPLLEHLRNVAGMAAHFASAFNSQHFAEWLGWWHDAGKVAPDIQEYLHDSNAVPPGPDHSSVGMLKAMEVMEPFAYNIAGHHGGLPDPGYLKDRIKRKREEPGEQRVRDALGLAETALRNVAPPLDLKRAPAFLKGDSRDTSMRRTEFWLRMLHSALVDADCLDTEAHFDHAKHVERTAARPAISELWGMFEERQRLMLHEATPSPVNRVRTEIYRRCIDKAEAPQGIFSLTVPTGGGKTRSALAFGLRHARRHDLRRVIVALPYTTIIEQNADVYRSLLGDAAVLEHHSSVQSKEEPGSEDGIERRQRMAAENWDAPVIVTTSVQLLESLFANRNSRVRKLHNIARSVLILDEIQTLPPHLLEPTLDVLRHLVDAYGVTVLLCTATQPAFLSTPDFAGFDNVTEILPDPHSVYEALQRVRYRVELDEPWSWNKIADELCSTDQAMVVMNTVQDALRLLDELPVADDVFHLSANLCGRHRREVLAEVRERLKDGRPVRLVATQVVEAGVDIDFPRVLRAIGPLDSIIQAAGRCNREGRLEVGEVVVFNPDEGRLPPDAYKRGAELTKVMLRSDAADELHNYAFPTRYFRQLYDISETDRRRVQQFRAQLSFVETARAYQLIDDTRTPVLVRYRADTERDRLIDKIKATNQVMRSDWRRLQPYIVSLRERRLKEAVALGVCRVIADGLYLLDDLYYDALRGVRIEQPSISDLIVDG